MDEVREMIGRRVAAGAGAVALAIGSVGAIGCGEDVVNDAADDVQKSAEEAVDDAGKAGEDAANEVEDAVDDTEKAGEDAANEVEDAGKDVDEAVGGGE